MNQHQAPVGTLATLGHPANNRRIRKATDNKWYYLNPVRPVDEEDFRAGWDIIVLGKASHVL